ncbi:hypothetical protein ACFYTQ_27375 [Nocardia sp. NPDC004068]|uniref:hypothetical protein n=1 Tax=Nocardia sp. NPDC004068 TaxID=3364303 RepID=UPI0036959BA3
MVVQDLESASKIDLGAADSIGKWPSYGGRSEAFVIELEFGHDIEDDKGIPFESHSIVVTVRDLNSDDDRGRKTAISILRRLHDYPDYDALLVHDLQELIVAEENHDAH